MSKTLTRHQNLAIEDNWGVWEIGENLYEVKAFNGEEYEKKTVRRSIGECKEYIKGQVKYFKRRTNPKRII